MAIGIDKIVNNTAFFLILFLFIAVASIEIFGCKWSQLFDLSYDSLITPGIKVIG
jgi:hypothetical protein